LCPNVSFWHDSELQDRTANFRLLADSVAKVGRVDWWHNFRFAAGSVLNLSFHVKAADESMLRASQSKILLQHILA
jgi:hypothetical protein